MSIISVELKTTSEGIGATFVRGRAFTAVANEVASSAYASFTRARTLQATATVPQYATASFARARGFSASGRLNNEANVIVNAGDAQFTRSRALSVTPRTSLPMSALFTGARELTATATVTRGLDFGFTFFVDIIPAALLSTNNIRRYAASFKASGVEIPVRSIVESAPRGAMGISLAIQLAVPEAAMVSASAALKLEIGVWDGAAFVWIAVLDGGRLAGRTVRYANAGGRPADTVSLTSLDLLGDRWTLAPSSNVTLYDPEKTDVPAPSSGAQIYDGTGVQLTTLSVPSPGLTLHAALDYAYKTGCGFTSVVTNLPDFPVHLVDFTIEAGWHGGVSGLLGLFDPLFFAGDGDALWIVDADAPLPAGLSPLQLDDAHVQSVEATSPARAQVSALVVSYTEEGGDYYTERIEVETTSTGHFGAAGYTSTRVTKRIREWRNLAAPPIIVREAVVSVETETSNTNFVVTGRETQTDNYDTLGRKTGHVREIYSLVPDLASDGALLLQRVESVNYSIAYRAGERDGTDEMARTVTEKSGLVLIDSDKPYLDKPYELPLRDAHRSGYVDRDANQATEFRAISTTIETYVREGASVSVRRQAISFLNGGTTEHSESATRAGSISLNRRTQSVVRRLLTVAGSETAGGRIIPTLSVPAGVPGSLALELGARKLARLNDPPRNVTIQIPYLDFRVRRGVVVQAHGRGGALLGTFIVEGYTRTLNALDTGEQGFSMSVQARELKS